MSAVAAFPVIAENKSALIASPNAAIRERVLRSLSGRWRRVHQVLGGADALAKLDEGEWQAVFLDRCLPDLDCEELVALIQRRFPAMQVSIIEPESENPRQEQGNAFSSELSPREMLAESLSFSPVTATHSSANFQKDNPSSFEPAWQPLPGMVGTSEAMQRVYRLAQLVAPRTTTVLILGPTGTGKELVARALHALSPRATKPFVAVNCAAIPETLLESELFGYARGAFTGAVQAQLGRIPAAHGGTLFLDEVGELPLSMQAKLLRFLEEKEIQRLGSPELTRVDVRVVAASNIDMPERASRGEFREDLFYRLSAFPIEMPALSDRRGDIVPLAEHFLACMSAAMSMPVLRLSPEAARILEGHGWRGNVRELQHVMERASILVENRGVVLGEHLYFPFQPPCSASALRPLSCGERAS